MEIAVRRRLLDGVGYATAKPAGTSIMELPVRPPQKEQPPHLHHVQCSALARSAHQLSHCCMDESPKCGVGQRMRVVAPMGVPCRRYRWEARRANRGGGAEWLYTLQLRVPPAHREAKRGASGGGASVKSFR